LHDFGQKKGPAYAEPFLFETELLNVASVTLGRATLLLVAVFTESLVSSVLVDSNLGRCTFVARFATEFIGMGLVIEGNVTLLVFVGDDIGSPGSGNSKGNDHDSNDQLLHLLFLLNK
jgi:hypothetical protein